MSVNAKQLLAALSKYFRRASDMWEGPDGSGTEGTDACESIARAIDRLSDMPMAFGNTTMRAFITPWQPMATVPKRGEFLLAVWEGEWRNPRQQYRVYEATGYDIGPLWAKRGCYRTEEGGAFEMAGWMPKPEPPQ